MFTSKDEHIQFLKDFAEKQFDEYLSNKAAFLCWEMFWTHYIEMKYMDFGLDILRQKIDNPSMDIDKMMPFFKLTAEHKQVFEDVRQKMNIQHHIKSVSYAEMSDKISEFFRVVRNIDFSSLSDAEKKELLVHEDIMDSDSTLYDYLALTHIQYKYLYQRGSVYI